MPFGGVGYSGQGRVHGKEGFEQFSNLKSVMVKSALDFPPFNAAVPPVSEGNKNVATWVLKKLAGSEIEETVAEEDQNPELRKI